MAKKPNKTTKVALILGGVIIVAVVLLVLIGQQSFRKEVEEEMPSNEPVSSTQEQEYPHFLLEGTVKSKTSSSLVIEADTSKITPAKKNSMDKTIKTTSKTKFVLYDMAKKKEALLKWADLKVGDSVVVATQESTFDEDNINKLEVFTADRISKYVNYPEAGPNE